MYYQLPSGKTISISLDEFLDLTDADIQYYMSVNHGTSVGNPFKGSSIDKKEIIADDDEEELDSEEEIEEDDDLEAEDIIEDELDFDDIEFS